MPEFIKVNVQDNIAVVTLDNPPLNLLGYDMLEELYVKLDRLCNDEQVHVIILTGSGERAFCGGGDRRVTSKASPALLKDGYIIGRKVYNAIRDFHVPVIAAVNGAAIGGGLALVASCDIVIASDNAVFSCPEVNVGMWPPYRYLARLVPELKMRMMVFSGQKITARELYSYGSIERVVNKDELMPTAMQIAREIAEKNSHLVRLFKKAINRGENMDIKTSLPLEMEYIQELIDLHDAAKIRRSFQK